MTNGAIKSTPWDGKTITKPGLYSGIPLGLYHSANICDGPSVSSSGLRKIFSESPAHFYASWPGNPNRKPEEDKTHFKIGRAIHHLMLGEPFFAKLFAVQPATYEVEEKERGTGEWVKTGEWKPWSNNALVCKRWNAEQAKAGRAVLTKDDLDVIRGMAESLGNNPLVRAGALNGMIERSGFYKDKSTGLWVKFRPDAIPTSDGDYTDLKTTTSVEWRDIQKTTFERGYHQQLGLMRTGARELGFQFSSATLLFIEKTDPFCNRAVTLKDSVLDRGERANRAALDAIADCMKAKRWPGPGGDREDAVGLDLPEWAEKQIDDRLKFGIAVAS